MQFLSGLAVFLLVLYIGRNLVKCSNGTNDSYFVISFLKQLHTEYCGVSSLCAAGIEHTEPENASFPLPCCTPCSCLTTCDSTNQYCCPDYMQLGTEGNNTLHVTAKPGLDVNKGAYRGNSSGVPQMQRFENGTYVISNNAIENNATDLNVSDLYAPDVKTECVRPQVTHKLNHLPDSQAYKMVTSCSQGNWTHSLKTKCEEKSNFKSFYDIVPVTSTKTGVTYVNKYCLFCNEQIDLLGRELSFWKTLLVAKGNYFDTTFFETSQAIAEAILKSTKVSFHRRNIHFAPVLSAMANKCELYDVTFCNATGLWIQYNETLESVCRFGQSLPIIAEISINKERKLFKNVACLYCNTDDQTAKKQYPCGYTKAGTNKGYKVGININTEMLPRTGKSQPMLDTRLSYIDNGTLVSLLAMTKTVCDSGYVYLLGACRKIYCPQHHYMVDTTCEPLFNTLSGIGITFKIQIDPSVALGDARDIDELATQLNLILNARLNEAVNVVICHASLWYVPRSHENIVQSYVFNVYLYNPNREMNFSQVIEEIHTFYRQIRYDSNITMSNGLTIRLEYKFGHNVINKLRTLVSRRLSGNAATIISLKILREKGKDMLLCGIPMSISDTNWCYRASVDLNETIDMGKRIKQLKHSGEVIYMDQFDYLNQSTLLVCIDLLTSKDILQKEMKKSIIKSSGNETPDIYELGGVAWYSTKTAIITYVILATVIVVALSSTVRSFVYSHRTEVQPPREATDDNYKEIRHDGAGR